VAKRKRDEAEEDRRHSAENLYLATTHLLDRRARCQGDTNPPKRGRF
jgi:hypothetical protein